MRLLEWYRIDRSRPMRRVLVAAALAMSTGSLVTSVSVMARASEAVRLAAALVGLVAVVAGPLIALLGLRRWLAEDLYVALGADGVIVHLEEAPDFMAWDTIERVSIEPATRAILFVLRSGETRTLTRDFAGITPEALAKRLDELRRKAGFRLL